MPVPGSGQLRLRADIALEVNGSADGTNVSLGALSNSAGFTEPDTMSEFYGYSSVASPTVETNSATNITSTSFTANGNATDDNGASITDKGFYIGTNANYASNTKITGIGSGTGAYSSARTGLSFNTTYYITAYAINSEGESVGSTITQLTSNATPPSVSANPSFTSVNVTSMTTRATFNNPDNLNVTYKVYFGTSSNYSSNTLYTVETSSGNPRTPSKNFTGLSATTTYYSRFVAEVSGLGTFQTTTTSQATPALATYQNLNNTYHVCYMPSAFNSAWMGTAHYIDVRQQFQYNHANYGYTNMWSKVTSNNSWSGTWNGDNSSSGYNVTAYVQQRSDTTQDTMNRTYRYVYTARQSIDSSNYFYTGTNLIHRLYQQSVPSSIGGRQVAPNSTTTGNTTCGNTFRTNETGAYGLKGYNAFSCGQNYNAVFGNTWQSTFNAP